MGTYFFRIYDHPELIVSECSTGAVPYEVAFRSYAICQWGGVIGAVNASSLKPWAKAVRIPARAYRIGGGAWCELGVDDAIWGCLLSAGGYREHALFAVVDTGMPLISRRKRKTVAADDRGRAAKVRNAEPIIKFEIPLPPADKLQGYLDLGWHRLPGSEGADYLKWSHGRGSPVHPEGIKPG